VRHQVHNSRAYVGVFSVDPLMVYDDGLMHQTQHRPGQQTCTFDQKEEALKRTAWFQIVVWWSFFGQAASFYHQHGQAPLGS
jgi:hypothetical protein